MEFQVDKMRAFLERDLFLKRMFEDLKKRNPHVADENLLEIIFTSEILGDSAMEDVYSSL